MPDCLRRSMERRILVECKVRAHPIVVGGVIRQRMAEVPFPPKRCFQPRQLAAVCAEPATRDEGSVRSAHVPGFTHLFSYCDRLIENSTWVPYRATILRFVSPVPQRSPNAIGANPSNPFKNEPQNRGAARGSACCFR